MRKSSKFIVVAGALAALAVPSVASASVTYDATNDGVITGHIDKGDVLPVLGWNDSKVQNTPVQFSTTFASITDKSWKCTNDSETRHNIKTVNFKMGLTAETLHQQSNGKITGWNLTGLGGLELVGPVTTGHDWLDCAGAGSVDYMTMNTAQSHSIGSDLLVNGKLLPETPVAMPAV